MQDEQLSSMIDGLTSEGIVRLMLEKHLPYIERMVEREKQSKEPLQEWARIMDVLINAAKIFQKNELAQMLFEAGVQTRIPISEHDHRKRPSAWRN